MDKKYVLDNPGTFGLTSANLQYDFDLGCYVMDVYPQNGPAVEIRGKTVNAAKGKFTKMYKTKAVEFGAKPKWAEMDINTSQVKVVEDDDILEQEEEIAADEISEVPSRNPKLDIFKRNVDDAIAHWLNKLPDNKLENIINLAGTKLRLREVQDKFSEDETIRDALAFAFLNLTLNTITDKLEEAIPAVFPGEEESKKAETVQPETTKESALDETTLVQTILIGKQIHRSSKNSNLITITFALENPEIQKILCEIDRNGDFHLVPARIGTSLENSVSFDVYGLTLGQDHVNGYYATVKLPFIKDDSAYALFNRIEGYLWLEL